MMFCTWKSYQNTSRMDGVCRGKVKGKWREERREEWEYAVRRDRVEEKRVCMLEVHGRREEAKEGKA